MHCTYSSRDGNTFHEIFLTNTLWYIEVIKILLYIYIYIYIYTKFLSIVSLKM